MARGFARPNAADLANGTLSLVGARVACSGSEVTIFEHIGTVNASIIGYPLKVY